MFRDSQRGFKALVIGGGLLLASAAHLPAQLIEYRFDNRADFNSGIVRNFRSTSYTGNLAGTRSQVRGALGNAVDFDGSTGALSAAGSTGLNFATGLTVEAFVRRDANTSEDAVASKWYAGGDQFLLTFYPTGNGQLIFSVRTSGGYSSVTYNVPNNVYLGEYIHVAGTYDGTSQLRLYWNGTQAASATTAFSGMAAGSAPIRVGDANNSWSRFDGAIDEVKIWTRALAASELSRPLRPRVLVVEYNSTNPTYNDPHVISNNVISSIANSSNYVNYQITQWIDNNFLPPQRTGGGFNYASLFTTYDVCGKASRGEIHEVWVWAGPDGGMLEWAVNGPYREAYGLGVGMPACDIQMVTMGFNYERQIPEALHSMGHRMEDNFRYYWGTYWNAFDGQYYRYGFDQANQPPLVTTGAHCGNVHFPPNANQHYEYGSGDVVSSNCSTWRSDGGGTYVNISCTAWGCTEDGFLRWWMARMPGPNNANGPGGTRLKSWWTTIAE